MRVFKRFLLILLAFGVLGGTGFGVLWLKNAADAHSLENIIIEPAPPQPAPPKEEVPIDPRLEGLTARKDGARLAYAAAPGMRLLSASFASDGALMLSTTAGTGKEERWRLLRLDLASGSSTALLESSAPRLASSHRAASLDKNRLCYSERDARRGVFEVWCAEADGKNPKQLTRHDGKEDLLSPAISPDGEWVAFEVAADRPKPQGSTIWKIRMDGAELQQLTRGADDRKPAWSDDGARLSFQRRPAAGGTSWDIYAMDANGQNAGPILRTHEEDETSPVRRAQVEEFLLVESASGTLARLKKIDGITKTGTYLTDGASGPESSPSISPDGALAAFLAPLAPERPESLGVWLLPLAP